MALPFFARFKSVDEAKEYCRKNSKTLELLKSKVPIDWNSKLGQELIETFILSESVSLFEIRIQTLICSFQALRFLIYRDLVSSKHTPELNNIFIVTLSYSMFAAAVWMGLHKYIQNRTPVELRAYAFVTAIIVCGLFYRKWQL